MTALYDEMRRSVAANAFSGAVMLGRKILMHAAVEKGAKAGDSFLSYVEWIADNHWVSPGSQGWVDYIRRRGNEANHEITVMQREDAIAILRLVEALLRNMYEFPAAVPGSPASNQTP